MTGIPVTTLIITGIPVTTPILWNYFHWVYTHVDWRPGIQGLKEHRETCANEIETEVHSGSGGGFQG